MGSGASQPTAEEVPPPVAAGPAAAGAEKKEESIVDKVKDKVGAAVTGEDEGVYNGFLVETNIKFDLSVPTNAVEGALCVVKVIVALIQAYVNRNKFLRAMEGRILAIDAAVKSLQKRAETVLEAALPALRNLVNLLVDYKQFVKYITKKPEGFFDKAVNFFRAKSDLENLADYDNLFTRSLSDLSVPLQADQIALMEEQRSTLQNLSADVARVLAKLDESRVLAISKRVLTHEESLSFWMDCFPDKFQAPVKEFVAALFLWMTESRGMQVTRRAVENIVTSVNLGDLNTADETGEEPMEDAPDEFIDAREANLLFVALPDNYQTMKVPDVIAYVVAFVKKRRAKELETLREARERAARKMESVAATAVQYSEAEKTFTSSLGNLFHARYVCEATSLSKSGQLEKRTDVQCIYITEQGTLQVLGYDPVSHMEANWIGRLYDDMSLELEIPKDVVRGAQNDPATAETMTARGEFRGNLFLAHCVTYTGLRATYIRLPTMVRWEGYWEMPNGQRGDMFLYIGEDKINRTAVCISDDDVGVAIWRGDMSETSLQLTKKYLNQHFVEYKGDFVKSGAGELRHVKGKWSIPGDWDGDFELWELHPEE
ncbi:Hypothetical protein, putative [Bodo saltans]|uniref:Uncharacterized protein n=1 Tax=Bodo saltans TaxID=75058 RepID=A0A0S4J364_BODSA|nr:Hypothetical protein, putative [Bodo saltans]|eukprot:CUG85433.1 Hypothetical protein, putative [Bodo saltans]